MATAILIDGDFFIRRCRFLLGKQTAQKTAADLHWMCREHLKQPERRRDLYRNLFHFILDPMWATIRPDLHEHIDGLRSVLQGPAAAPPAPPPASPPQPATN
jgi:hypothetical protein